MVHVYKHRDYLDETSLQTGDIRVTQHLDYHGKKNLSGNHTNYGYSANVLVYVWDGERWAWLQNKDKPNFQKKVIQKESEEVIGDYLKYFGVVAQNAEFSFWWWKRKRFVGINNKNEDLERKVMEQIEHDAMKQ